MGHRHWHRTRPMRHASHADSRNPGSSSVDTRGQCQVEALGLGFLAVSVACIGNSKISLPEFLDFKLFGKTSLVVHKKFGLFLADPLRK